MDVWNSRSAIWYVTLVVIIVAVSILLPIGKTWEGNRQSTNEYENICYVSVVKRMAIVTAYTAGRESTGKEHGHSLFGITASGTKVSTWHTIAMDKHVPFGTKVYIPYFRFKGNSGLFAVEDRGGAIKLNRKPVGVHKVDVYMPTRKKAIEFGRRVLPIYIFLGRNYTMNVPKFPNDFEMIQGVPLTDEEANGVIRELANFAKDECGSVSTGDTVAIKIGDTYYLAKDGRMYVSELVDGKWQ